VASGWQCRVQRLRSTSGTQVWRRLRCVRRPTSLRSTFIPTPRRLVPPIPTNPRSLLYSLPILVVAHLSRGIVVACNVGRCFATACHRIASQSLGFRYSCVVCKHLGLNRVLFCFLVVGGSRAAVKRAVANVSLLCEYVGARGSLPIVSALNDTIQTAIDNVCISIIRYVRIGS
jgi:hypothetical protein